MTSQPRARIPLFRFEVKERCAGIMLIAFIAITDVPTIVTIVQRQLSNYRYTFPTSTLVSNHFSWEDLLSSFQDDPFDAPPICTWPYRNARIITVIQDLYFIGGRMSFAQHYERCIATIWVSTVISCIAKLDYIVSSQPGKTTMG